MAQCSVCNSSILFGGVRDGENRFCSKKCHRQGLRVSASSQIPDNMVQQAAWEIYQGSCPKCQGSGPIDVHTSHQVWSALFLTSWRNTKRISCRRCGIKAQLGDLAFSFVLGWWGIPFGVLMTPVQIVQNFISMVRETDKAEPSAKLVKMTRLKMAERAMAKEPAQEPDA